MKTPALALLLALAAAPAGAEAPPADAPPIRHDPFRRPAPPPGAGVAPGSPDGGPAAAAPWQPILRGVLLAGPNSLANVGGRMMAVGETLDGRRLVAIRENQAVFEMNGQRTVLDMRRPLESKP